MTIGASLLAGTQAGGAAAETAATTTRIDFENTEIGRLPPGFTTGLTGGGGPVRWVVATDATAPAGPKVLAQTSTDRTDHRFPLAILDAPLLADLAVSVRFKPVAGEIDRAAGIALRRTDAANYYVVRANALEDNVRLYHVVGGVRTQFAGVDVKIPSGAWQQLAIAARGRSFEVSLDGKTLFSATDTRLTTAGRVALWTKADSVTYFDDLQIRNL